MDRSHFLKMAALIVSVQLVSRVRRKTVFKNELRFQALFL